MQILPPWNDDVKFENFITSYFNDLEKTLSYDRFGRLGQKQFGLDVYSIEKKTVIQCKLKLLRGGNDERIRKELIDELDRDFNSFVIYNESNKLGFTKFIFASTFPSDTHLATECSKRSNDNITVEYWGWDKIQSNLPVKVFKTYYSEFLGFFEECYQKYNLPYFNNTEYIQDINTFDFILKENYPSKNQVSFVTRLIQSDRDYCRYFYTRLDNPNWYQILKSIEEFNYSKNPPPIQVNNGFQIPYWEILTYLEKLSVHIKCGRATELIDEIINVICIVSENHVDNYRTWFSFIRILSNLPNEAITLDVLNFIPVWLGGRFDTTIQSHEICDNLLPKFLNSNPTSNDIEKAELIIKHLLHLDNLKSIEQDTSSKYESYRSRVHMHNLKITLTDKSNLERIAQHCSTDIIYLLIENIRNLRLSFPSDLIIKVKADRAEYEIKTIISNSDLLVTLTSEDILILTSKISGFEKFDKQGLKNNYRDLLLQNNIALADVEENELNFEYLINSLFNGAYYMFYDEFISKLHDRFHSGDNPVEVFSLVLRDVLNQFTKAKIDIATSLLKDLSNNPRYRLPFFQRIVLYVIGENWSSTRNLFLDMILEGDSKKIFSNSMYQNELYELLDNNQENLNEEELSAIQEILELGPKEQKNNTESYLENWRFRWYSALRKLPKYSELYDEFSKRTGMTMDHFDKDEEIQLTEGDRSPLTIEEVLEMSSDKIAKYILSFKPKDKWEEPTIAGFSRILARAIEMEPLRFSNEVYAYKDVYYIYAYQIANGFREAWKSKRAFNWEKVLQFFHEYIKDERFSKGQFFIENDGWSAASDWVIGSVANLLSEGMQSDNNAFDLELLALAKNILSLLLMDLEPKEYIQETRMDYPMYSLNSTSGKVLRACLDYALRVGRTKYSKSSLVKWDHETKEFFELAAKKNLIDLYVLTGWYYQQFYFLDCNWISEKIRSYHELDDKYWFAFIGGFEISNPPNDTTLYNICYPHYERAIKSNIKLERRFDFGIIRHIAAFYFWGFEDLNSKGLLYLVLAENNPKSILELVNFIWGQEKYINGLKDKERIRFVKIIFELWSLLASKYENSSSDEELRVLIALSNFLQFAPEISDVYTNLLLKSIKIDVEDFPAHFFIENLNKKKDKGDSTNNAKNIGIILNSIPFKPYFSSTDIAVIEDLVSFLYQNGQKLSADEFCNKMVKKGHEFLKEIFNKNQI